MKKIKIEKMEKLDGGGILKSCDYAVTLSFDSEKELEWIKATSIDVIGISLTIDKTSKDNTPHTTAIIKSEDFEILKNTIRKINDETIEEKDFKTPESQLTVY